MKIIFRIILPIVALCIFAWMAILTWRYHDLRNLQVELSSNKNDQAWIKLLIENDIEQQEDTWESLNYYLTNRHEVLNEQKQTYFNTLIELLTKKNTILAHLGLNSNWYSDEFMSNSERMSALFVLQCNTIKWLLEEVEHADDPLPLIDHLDDLLEANVPDVCGIYTILNQHRDRAYISLILKNVLPEELINMWLVEKPRSIEASLEKSRLERNLIWEPLVRGGLKMINPSLFASCNLHFDIHAKVHTFADWIHSSRLWEDILKGVKDPADNMKETSCLIWPLGNSPTETLFEILVSDAHHRMARLLILTMQLTGDLPFNEKELKIQLGSQAILLEGGKLQLPIHYTLVSDNRVRFYIPSDLSHLNVLIKRPNKLRLELGEGRKPQCDTSSLSFEDYAIELQRQSVVPGKG